MIICCMFYCNGVMIDDVDDEEKDIVCCFVATVFQYILDDLDIL